MPWGEAFGMELDGDAPREDAVVVEFGGFDEAVGCDRNGPECGGEGLDGLMMGAVDVEGAPADGVGEDRRGVEGDGVDGVILEVELIVGDGARAFGGEIDVEIAAEGDIEDLEPAADGEEGFGMGKELAQKEEFGEIPGGIDTDTTGGEIGWGVRAMDGGTDVIPAGEQDAVAAGEGIADGLGILGGREDPGEGSGLQECIGVTGGQAEAGISELDASGCGRCGDEDEGATRGGHGSGEGMIGEEFPDAFADGDDVTGFVAAADMAAFEGVEKGEPIVEGRLGERGPLDVATAAAGAFEELPIRTDVLGVDVAGEAVLAFGGPTDFSFGTHGDQG